MLCDFKVTALADGTFKHECANCQTTRRSRMARYIRICAPAAPPRPARKLLNFSLAAIKHVAKGMPSCTQEEIDARIAVCHTCELYLPNENNPEVGVCGHPDCGCAIKRESKFVSKLAWRDQKCPMGKWPDLGPAEGL